MTAIRTRGVSLRVALAAASASALGVTACLIALAPGTAFSGAFSSGPRSLGAHPGAPSGAIAGGTVYFAEPAGSPPSFIFPFMSSRFYGTVNTSDFQYLMYRPLYFFGQNGSPVLNTGDSLADPPSYANGGKTVTLTLKDYKWSNGESVTAQDVEFWLNMDKVEKLVWAAYSKGALPDDVASVSVRSSRSLTIQLTGAVNEDWFTYNELSQITPFPMAWDVSGSGEAAGSQACGTASYQSVTVRESSAGTDVRPLSAAARSCAAVYAYLEKESGFDPSKPAAPNNSIGSYATNPLWGVADGPFELSSMDASGKAVFVPNRRYSGPVRPMISQFVELPYASSTAEFNALAAGQLTVGYLPYDKVTSPAPAPMTPGANSSRLRAFEIAPWYGYGINYTALNFDSVADGGEAGRLFGQLYFREALQLLVDQPAEVQTVYKGYALATYGPVPSLPQSPFLAAGDEQGAYRYDPAAAVSLLKAHGWTVKRYGTSVCAAAAKCGVPAGTPAAFSLQYTGSGGQLAELVAGEQAAFAEAGITVSATSSGSGATRCAGSGCTWAAEEWGSGPLYIPDHYPSGENLFETGAVQNVGSYSSPSVDALIAQTDFGSADLTQYADEVAEQLPVIWQPEPTYQITEVQKALQGVVPQSPYLNLDPEDWYFAKS